MHLEGTLMLSYKKYGQYKSDIFNKLNFKFIRGSTILDIGCGDGTDGKILSEFYGLSVTGIDVYRNKKLDEKYVKFTKAGVLDFICEDKFDYIFMHDVLHHIDEKKQSLEVHIAALKRMIDFLKPGGEIIIIEGNRYNPLFYPHMVKMLGHEHFSYRYFRNLIDQSYPNKNFKVNFSNFEAHSYPGIIRFWKAYEFIMEKFMPERFLANNVAFIKDLNE